MYALLGLRNEEIWTAPKMNQIELEATKKFSSNAHMKTRKEVKSTLDSLISSEKSDLVKGQLTEQRATYSKHQIGAAAYKKVNVAEEYQNVQW